MNLLLSSDQEALRDGIRSLCSGRFPMDRVRAGFDAEVWKELFDAEGVSNQIKPPINGGVPMSAPREIWVPDSKTHVAEEILRKI